MIQPARLERWWDSMGGRTPACFIHYEMAHPDCDGNPPCSFKAACRALQRFAHGVGTSAEKFKASVDEETLKFMAWKALHGRDGKRSNADRKRHWLAWNRFVDAFQSVLPAGTHVAPKRDLAIPTELFVSLDRGNEIEKVGLPRSFKVSVRSYGTSSVDLAILRFWPRPLLVVEPTVSLRIAPKELAKLYPEVKGMCRRVTGRLADIERKTTNNVALDTTLRRVYPEFIEDVARLCARMMMRGELADVTWPLDTCAARTSALHRASQG